MITDVFAVFLKLECAIRNCLIDECLNVWVIYIDGLIFVSADDLQAHESSYGRFYVSFPLFEQKLSKIIESSKFLPNFSIFFFLKIYHFESISDLFVN